MYIFSIQKCKFDTNWFSIFKFLDVFISQSVYFSTNNSAKNIPYFFKDIPAYLTHLCPIFGLVPFTFYTHVLQNVLDHDIYLRDHFWTVSDCPGRSVRWWLDVWSLGMLLRDHQDDTRLANMTSWFLFLLTTFFNTSILYLKRMYV